MERKALDARGATQEYGELLPSMVPRAEKDVILPIATELSVVSIYQAHPFAALKRVSSAAHSIIIILSHPVPHPSSPTMHFPSPFTLLPLLALTSSVYATTCHQDNCYRALQNRPAAATSFCRLFTTSTMAIPTATPPPFANQCEWSPHRINSACSCLVPKVTTTSGPCAPTPAMDVARNGGFDQVAINSVGAAIPSMKPWSWEGMRGARGDFMREGPGIYFGEGAA